ncbi:MAG: flavin reductase family protein [Proteobacteria bacterium]|nr:flavin reductase family protein [Pseudomonadota bacterium]
MFVEIDRNQLRDNFQPARLVLVVVGDPKNNRFNFLPIAHNMHCSYKPHCMAVAVDAENYSYGLLQNCDEFVIAVPTESLAETVLKSGNVSGRHIDKFKEFGLTPLRDDSSKAAGIKECKANVFCKKIAFHQVGGDAIVVGQFEKILLDADNHEKNLLSFGAGDVGFLSLAHEGKHNIGVVKDAG